MKTNINIIAAVARNGAIGRHGDLLYHLGADLRHFKQVTMGWPIVMGRRTFESFPNGALPGRRNIVITRNASYAPAGAETAPGLDEALKMCEGVEQVFIIGGGEIYRQAISRADRLLLTEIDASPDDADTFFPPFDRTLVEAGEWQGENPRFRFVTYS